MRMIKITSKYPLIIRNCLSLKSQLFTMLQKGPSQSILKGTMCHFSIISEYSKRTVSVCFTYSQKETKKAHFPFFSRYDIMVRDQIVSEVISRINRTYIMELRLFMLSFHAKFLLIFMGLIFINYCRTLDSYLITPSPYKGSLTSKSGSAI